MIGLVADAHGNGLAFDRAVSLLLEKGAEQLYFLGDAVGYVPSTSVLDSLVCLGDRVSSIRGNHESMLLEGNIDPKKEAVYQLEALRPSLSSQHLKMISSWPILRKEKLFEVDVMMVHGSPSDPTYGYVYQDSDLDSFFPDSEWIFMANTHYPFIRRYGERCYVNIGSCGMPRDDGRYGSVALFDAKARRVQILRFDIKNQSQYIIAKFPSVHPSVRAIYDRRQPTIIGDIF